MAEPIMQNYRLSDLLDMSLIQKLANSNFKASGIPMSIIDAFDTSVLVTAGWTDICTHFHRANPLSGRCCTESDASAYDKLTEGNAHRYRCKNGMWHLAIPIIVSGRHMGTMFLSQFLVEGEVPEQERFIRQAEEFGYDLDAYLSALNKIPVFSVEKIDYIIAYDMAMAHFISDLAEHSLSVIETKASLGESEVKYHSLVDNLNVGIYGHPGNDGIFVQANPAMAKIFGYDTVDDLMKVSEFDLYQNAEDPGTFKNELKMYGFVKDREIVMKKKGGEPIWCSFTSTAQFDRDGNILWVEGVIEDITERKKSVEELQRAKDELEMRVQARTADLAQANKLLLAEISERMVIEGKLLELAEKDPLTMIYNRRKLFELLRMEIEKARRYARPLSLIMIDIDHFKKINDNYGHTIGDIVLKTTTDIIQGGIRKVDIFARYGGEEFIILSPETDINGAVALAEKIRSLIEGHPFPTAGIVTISTGVVELTDKDSGDCFIEKADCALYMAKKNGRNRVEKIA